MGIPDRENLPSAAPHKTSLERTTIPVLRPPAGRTKSPSGRGRNGDCLPPSPAPDPDVRHSRTKLLSRVVTGSVRGCGAPVQFGNATGAVPVTRGIGAVSGVCFAVRYTSLSRRLCAVNSVHFVSLDGSRPLIRPAVWNCSLMLSKEQYWLKFF